MPDIAHFGPTAENGDEPPIFLLGAGASVEAGLPASTALTDQILEHLRRSQQRELLDALNFICATLVAYDGAEGRDYNAALDVERVVAAVRLLAERSMLEITPFVSAWHPALDKWRSRRRSDLPDDFDERFARALTDNRGYAKPRDELVRLIEAVITERDGSDVYTRLSAEMVRSVEYLLDVQPSDVAYLAPLVDLGRRPGGITIASLNYDLAIEMAAERQGVPCATGLLAARPFANWPDQGIRLLKLHGSVDWVWHREGVEPPRFPSRQVVPRLVGGSDDEPALVFGAREKLRAEGPFLRLLSEFEDQLSRANHLVCIGYGFHDEHINVLVGQWLAGRTDARITVVDPAFDHSDKHDFRHLLFSRSQRSWTRPRSTVQRVDLRAMGAGEFLRRPGFASWQALAER